MSETRRRTKPRPPPVEAKPILAGRLWIAIAMLLGLAVMANPPFNQFIGRYGPKEQYTKRNEWRIGGTSNVTVTVITADANRLDCSTDKTIKGYHCGFDADGKAWPKNGKEPLDDNNAKIIQPYRTSPDNHLILIAGLWAQPAVAMRLHREPPEGKPIKRLQRFEARCKLEFLGDFDEVKLRWETGASWRTEKDTMVARALSCTVK